MEVSCPACGSRNLRYSYVETVAERILALAGIRPLRCRDCRHRFRGRTWRLRGIFYARCPRCWRMDLATWSEEHYWVPLSSRLLIRLGGKRLRCEYCRVNFVSFRPRRRRYQHHRKAKGVVARVGS